jgi:hypothetical protein
MRWKQKLAKEDIPRDDRSKQETIEYLKEELQKSELRSRIAKMDEKASKQKIFTAISAVGSFLIVTFLFSNYLTAAGKSPDVSAALSLVAGFFAAFLIMAASGIIKEFTVKSGIIEVSSKLEEKIEIVQTNIEESKKEVEEKISALNQNIALAMSSIAVDNKIANMNQNQNKMSQQVPMHFNFGSGLPDEEKRRVEKEAKAKRTQQIANYNDRNIEDIVKNAPIKSEIKQQALEEDG